MDSNIRSSSEALSLLQEGNQRFISGVRSVESFTATPQRVRELAEKGQNPFAVVLGCADSRVPAEIIFDRGLGDLFVPRVAGNICTPHTLATIEYAALTLGTPLCVVLGHSRCGAVGAAVRRHFDSTPLPSANLERLIGQIEPAVCTVLGKAGVKSPAGHHSCTDGEIAAITEENVRNTLRQIQEQSEIIRDLIARGRFALAGAVCDLSTGRVDFLREDGQTASRARAAAEALAAGG